MPLKVFKLFESICNPCIRKTTLYLLILYTIVTKVRISKSLFYLNPTYTYVTEDASSRLQIAIARIYSESAVFNLNHNLFVASQSIKSMAASLIIQSIKCHHIESHHQQGDGEQDLSSIAGRTRWCLRPRCPGSPACQCP